MILFLSLVCWRVASLLKYEKRRRDGRLRPLFYPENSREVQHIPGRGIAVTARHSSCQFPLFAL
jgi:hypothetical protein